MTRATDDFDFIQQRLAEIKGETVEPEVCPNCEGGGYELSSYQGAVAPNFQVCAKCGNPEGHPCP